VQQERLDPLHALTASGLRAVPGVLDVTSDASVDALSEMGGGSPGYRVSKAGVNALVRMLAAETAGANVLVNAACPGWVRTDMGGAGATLTVAQSAAGLRAALARATPAQNGAFLNYDGTAIPW